MIKNLTSMIKLLSPWLFWLALVAVSVLLLVEIKPSESGWPYFDKLVHITIFLTLGVLGYIAYTNNKLIVWFGLAGFGIATEYLQSTYTETRIGSIYDWLADITGILLSLFFIYIIKTIYLKKHMQ